MLKMKLNGIFHLNRIYNIYTHWYTHWCIQNALFTNSPEFQFRILHSLLWCIAIIWHYDICMIVIFSPDSLTGKNLFYHLSHLFGTKIICHWLHKYESNSDGTIYTFHTDFSGCVCMTDRVVLLLWLYDDNVPDTCGPPCSIRCIIGDNKDGIDSGLVCFLTSLEAST